MKKYNKIFALVFVLVIALFITGCKKDEKESDTNNTNTEITEKNSYEDYIGYQFSGKDSWGNELAITVRTLENDKLTWTYTTVVGEAEESMTLYNELTTDFVDGVTSFNVSGNTDKELYTFDYSGTLTLKDGNLIVTYTAGQITNNSPEGGSTSHNVGALEEASKTFTLTKVVDNS